jgi:hypothetical protein
VERISALRYVEVTQRRLPCAAGARPSLGTLKIRMGATHFLIKAMLWVASEIALRVLSLQSVGLH